MIEINRKFNSIFQDPDVKYKDKYRIESARLQSWDYGNDGSYFITICTKNREHFFGEIRDSKMCLSEMGVLAKKHWLEIPERFPFIELGNFVIMPNHVHGVLIIDKIDTPPVNARLIVPQFVETRLIASLQIGGITGNKNPMFHENISRVVRWYKGRCTFEIRKIDSNFKWQTRFHDHVIRDSGSFESIRNYILNNPLNWNEDRFYE